MAFRDDVIIDWSQNPRIIEVAAPSTEITVQDLYDTLRELEQQPQNMVYSSICRGDGRVALGAGLFTVVTLTLLDAVLTFEARPGPAVEKCKVVQGNLVSLDTGTETFLDYPAIDTANVYTMISQATTGGISYSNVDNLSLEQTLKALLAVASGKMVVTNNGPNDNTVEFKGQDDTTTYVTGRVVDGIRTEADVNEENM